MNWLILVIIAVLTDVLRIFTDNYISDVYYKGREVAGQKVFSAWAKTITSIIILVIAGFSFDQFSFSSILLLLLSGLIASIAEVPYYIALGIEDSTNYGIFLQLAPVLYLVLGWFFLGDSFSPVQLVAIAIVLIAPLLIVITSRKRSRKVKIRAALLAFLAVVISVIGNILFIKINNGTSDIPTLIKELSLLLLGVGLGDFAIMGLMPKWRKRYHRVRKDSKNKVLTPLFATFVVGTIKTFIYRMALVLAPAAALVSATSDSIEPIAIFFMGVVLTLIWPKFGREKLNRKTVLIHLIATLIVVVGVILMQL